MGKKIEMTAEQREALLGALPFDSSASIEFTPDFYDDAPDEFSPVFTLRALSKGDYKELLKALSKAAKAVEDGVGADDSVTINLARKCIVGWRNLIDLGKSEEIDFESENDGGAKAELVNRLPNPVVSAILQRVIKISGLMPVDKLSLKS